MTKNDIKNLKVVITSKIEIDADEILDTIKYSSPISDDEEFTKEELYLFVRENCDWFVELVCNAKIEFVEN